MSDPGRRKRAGGRGGPRATVGTERRNIVRRLGLHGTAELTKDAFREGLTSPDE
jgi:hypothetical protein